MKIIISGIYPTSMIMKNPNTEISIKTAAKPTAFKRNFLKMQKSRKTLEKSWQLKNKTKITYFHSKW
jgi:hypothetical protein